MFFYRIVALGFLALVLTGCATPYGYHAREPVVYRSTNVVAPVNDRAVAISPEVREPVPITHTMQDDCPKTKAQPFAPYKMGNPYSKAELIALLQGSPEKMARYRNAMSRTFGREVTDAMVIDAINAAQVVKASWRKGEISTDGVCPNGGFKEITRHPYTHTSGSTEDALLFEGAYIGSLWCLNPIADLRSRDDGMRETAPAPRVEYRTEVQVVERPVYIDRPVYVESEPVYDEYYGGLDVAGVAYGVGVGFSGDRYYSDDHSINGSFNDYSSRDNRRYDNRRSYDDHRSYRDDHRINVDNRQWNNRPRHRPPSPPPPCRNCGGGGRPADPPTGPDDCVGNNCNNPGYPRSPPTGSSECVGAGCDYFGHPREISTGWQ